MGKIRRVLFILGLVAAVSAAFAGYMRNYEILSACAVLLFLAAVFIILKVKFQYFKWFAVISLCAAIFLMLGCYVKVCKIRPAAQLSGNSAVVCGYLYEDPETDGAYQTLSIKTERIALEGAPQNIKLCINTPVSDSYQAGDVISAEVSFTEINNAYKNSYYADGIYITANSYNVSATGEQKLTPYIAGAKLAAVIKSKIALLFPADCLGLLNGLCIGDTSMMPDEAYANFVGSGIIHLVNVSGLHLSIIAGSVYSLFKGKLKKIAAPISALAVFLIMAVTGFSESTLRAGIMFSVMLLGGLVSRKSDSLNSLGLAMLIMLAVNPMLWASGSFLLTCTSVAGIVLLQQPVYGYGRSAFKGLFSHVTRSISHSKFNRLTKTAVNIINKIWEVSSVSIAASIAVMPILIIIYQNLSFLSVFANLMTVTVVMYTLVALIITIILSIIPYVSVLVKPLVVIISAVCRYTEWVAELFGSTEASSLSFGCETSWIIVIFLLITAGGLLLISTGHDIKAYVAIILCLTVPLAGVLAVKLRPDYDCKVIIPNVGDGYCAIAVSGHEAVIIGSGDEYSDAYIIEDELRRFSVDTVKAVIIPGGESTSGSALRLRKTYGCNIYTQNTKEYDSSVGAEELKKLNITMGEMCITPLAASEGFAVKAEVYGRCIIFQTKNIGDTGYNGRCACIIMSPGAASSQIGIAAETLIITNGGHSCMPLDVKPEISLGDVYIADENYLVNLHENGAQVLTSRSTTFKY